MTESHRLGRSPPARPTPSRPCPQSPCRVVDTTERLSHVRPSLQQAPAAATPAGRRDTIRRLDGGPIVGSVGGGAGVTPRWRRWAQDPPYRRRGPPPLVPVLGLGARAPDVPG